MPKLHTRRNYCSQVLDSMKHNTQRLERMKKKYVSENNTVQGVAEKSQTDGTDHHSVITQCVPRQIQICNGIEKLAKGSAGSSNEFFHEYQSLEGMEKRCEVERRERYGTDRTWKKASVSLFPARRISKILISFLHSSQVLALMDGATWGEWCPFQSQERECFRNEKRGRGQKFYEKPRSLIREALGKRVQQDVSLFIRQTRIVRILPPARKEWSQVRGERATCDMNPISTTRTRSTRPMETEAQEFWGHTTTSSGRFSSTAASIASQKFTTGLRWKRIHSSR